MENRRKEMRKKVMAFTPVYRLEPGKPEILLGFLGDLTLHGALVIGEKTLEVGQPVRLGIEFPASLPGILGTRLTVQTQVTRCVREEESPDFRLGFEFGELSPEQIKTIEALLERYNYRYQ